MDVLFAESLHDIACGNPECRHAGGVKPDAHRVVELAQKADIAHPWNANEFISQLDKRVVAQIKLVSRLVRGDEIDHKQNAWRAFLYRNASLFDFARQGRDRKINTVLHEDLGHIQIGADVEGYRDATAAVVGTLGRHVEHFLDAENLLFDWCCDRFGNDLSTCTGVEAGDLNSRRCDIGVLGDR